MQETSSTVSTLAELQRNATDWLLSQGLDPDISALLIAIAGVIAMVLLAFIFDTLARWILAKLIPVIFNRIADPERSKVWQDALTKHTLAQRSAHLFAALTVYLMTPQVLNAYPSVVVTVLNIIEGYLILVIMIAINALLRAGADVLRQGGWSARVSLQFIVQAGQAIVWLVGIILIISVVFDTSVSVLLTSLAGISAILVLVFKDTLLGYVAGIQILNNDLVREGDWIDVPKHGANGTVTDIGLITVKVRNWDKTISSIPSYSLISDGFRNWRGMYGSGGRRIKRAIPIDISGISFCTEEMLERLRKIEILRDYIDQKLKEIESFNREHAVDETVPENGRRLTNIGIFRVYLQEYLKHHPDIHDDMTLMVRQLEPGPEGLLIELYAFSTNQQWAAYEAIQSDILDHALASLPAFGLSALQFPSSGAFHASD